MQKRIMSSLFTLSLMLALTLWSAKASAATTLTVTNTNDSGTGSLRQAIADATSGNTINFSLSNCPCTITLVNSELLIDNTLTVQGPGANLLTIRSAPLLRHFVLGSINPAISVTLSGMTLVGEGNDTFGGGIENYSTGNVYINSITFMNNVAYRGGGLANDSTGNVTVGNSTFSNNSSNWGGGLNNYSTGGVSVSNSTFSRNEAKLNGGGLNSDLGPLVLTNCTVTGNHAGYGGGIYVNHQLTLHNDLVAGNLGIDEIHGTITGTHNILGHTEHRMINGVNSNIIISATDINTVLDTKLANNGGPTPTHRLVLNSLAIDKGDNQQVLQTTDQRGKGFSRVHGNTVDIGAVEYGGSAVALGQMFDYDGDGLQDLALIKPTTTRTWYILPSQAQLDIVMQWGRSIDFPVYGDFDGDGKTDLAAWYNQDGTWSIKQSSDGATFTKRMGVLGDMPVRGDFDGDGKTDLAVWRSSNGTWYVEKSSDGKSLVQQWGSPGDVPVPGDYDGDGKTDWAVFRPSSGMWYIIPSGGGATISQQWGNATDVPMVGDFDGDGRCDLTVWRGSVGNWYVWNLKNSTSQAIQWGSTGMGDLPVLGDYDGDGKADPAVWRVPETNWYVRQSGTGTTYTRVQGQGQYDASPVLMLQSPY